MFRLCLLLLLAATRLASAQCVESVLCGGACAGTIGLLAVEQFGTRLDAGVRLGPGSPEALVALRFIEAWRVGPLFELGTQAFGSGALVTGGARGQLWKHDRLRLDARVSMTSPHPWGKGPGGLVGVTFEVSAGAFVATVQPLVWLSARERGPLTREVVIVEPMVVFSLGVRPAKLLSPFRGKRDVLDPTSEEATL